MITQRSIPRRVFFSGYAPVHFLCYLPVYQRLRKDPDVRLYLSGGFRRKVGSEISYVEEGFYDDHAVDPDHVISIEEARQSDFDVLVSSHLSDGLFPRSASSSVQIFHGVSFKNLSVREKALSFDYLCLPGRYHGEMYRKQSLIRPDGAQVLVTGFPKSDALVADGFDRAALLRRYKLDPERPTILFAPTGEKHNALEAMGEEVIRAIDGAGSWNLLVKPHDHPKRPTDWSGLSKLENERVRLVRDLDVVPYLLTADLLLTDASSVAVEYTLLDRPIVFLEVPKLLERVSKRAPALDLETYGRKVGVVVSRTESLADAIAASLADPDRECELRRKMAGHLFHDPGGAVERVARIIRYAAGLEVTLPDGAELLRP